MKMRFIPIFLSLVCVAYGAQKTDLEARVRELESKVNLLDAMRIQQGKEIDTRDRRIKELELLLVEGPPEKPVMLSGPVRRTGIFRYEKGMTLGRLIEKAGGFTADSHLFMVKIARRAAKHEKHTIEFQFAGYYPTSSEIAASPELLPGDIVYAPERIK
jgi:hypothetical protein